MKIYSDFPFKKPEKPLHIAKVSLRLAQDNEEPIHWLHPPASYGKAYNPSTEAVALSTLAEMSDAQLTLTIQELAYQAPYSQETMGQVLVESMREAATKLKL
ncbi:hypothetical protein SAMN02745181_2093 [Rubritalea squalenifaciens DSM 18772]|uniref:Uncharacterized protein n=1 Tax=Rubritalea squalenifaciens DSM 18772 TaxID=1123071 RepID=A0A1M6JEA1_9BACT|nr:hypothetical protein [Rubritalea squalenifaciens]SHJ44912.1 hypothetical protein SAMN02745181_2093 [Rubritalea squalenifaciens DSM 18772]